jgi:hypothetical protein
MGNDENQEAPKATATAPTPRATEAETALAGCPPSATMATAATDTGCTSSPDGPKTGRDAPLDDREEH